MSKKVITILLMSALVLSLACGCKNNDTESTSSTASKVESSVSSSTESSKQNKSSTESNNQSESKVESSKRSEASTDKDYEEMMSYANQLSNELTYEQVLEILGEPDESYGSGIHHDVYNFGKYSLVIFDFNSYAEIYNNETNEASILYNIK